MKDETFIDDHGDTRDLASSALKARDEGLSDIEIAAVLGLQLWQVEDLLRPRLVPKKPTPEAQGD